MVLFQQPLLSFSNPSINRVTFSPLDVTGLILWLDANDLSTITKSSDLVSQWDDKSGQGNDLTEATNKPLWVDGAHNSKDTIRFDGTNDAINIDAFTGGALTQPSTIFIVCTFPDAADETVFDNALGGTTRHVFESSTTVYQLYAGTIATTGTADASFAQFNVLFSTTASVLRRNKTDVGTGLDVGTQTLDGFVLGNNQESYELESGVDNYLLEDSSGQLLIDQRVEVISSSTVGITEAT
jgi:hypothetical protein